jgi:HK97 family phage prohead protease
MEIEYSNPLEIAEFKAQGDDWLVDGYVATFNDVDMGNDKIMPGAFKKTLRDRPKVRFLMSHDPALVLGIPKKLREDEKGLFGSFKISKTTLGEDVHELLLDGALDSFSIGYHAVEWKITEGDIRQLDEIALFETSLVSLPMNPEATVTRVKYMSLADKAIYLRKQLDELLQDLRGPASHADRPLSATKQKELTELLELCSGFDAVRQELESVLTPIWSGSPMTLYKLTQARKRLEHILQE